MRPNTLKQKLAVGEVVVGAFINLPCPEVVELSALVGFDFVVIDCEHGPMNLETALHMVRAADAIGITPLIRSAESTPQHLLRYLDTGAAGMQVPQVNTPEDFERVVRAVKFQPRGWRGLAGTRPADYGLGQPMTDYVQAANRETMIVMHIETKEAVDNLDALLAVDGVDVYFLGPSDLSQALGIPGQVNDPRVLDLVRDCAAKITAAGKVAGTMAMTVERAKQAIDQDMRYITVGSLALFANAGRTYVGGVKEPG